MGRLDGRGQGFSDIGFAVLGQMFCIYKIVSLQIKDQVQNLNIFLTQAVLNDGRIFRQALVK